MSRFKGTRIHKDRSTKGPITTFSYLGRASERKGPKEKKRALILGGELLTGD